MHTSFITARLLLNELTVNDAAFIKKLVNTEGWIKFIGERNVKSHEDAVAYIQKIIDNPNTNYLVVTRRDSQIPIGIVTFIKRDYLEHHDIGFAFLPQYIGQGYAYEATAAVLESLLKNPLHQCILATTLKKNINSIRLLERLNFKFDREIEAGNEKLSVYAFKNRG